MIISNTKIKEEGKDQELIQSSMTPDPGHHIWKWQNHKITSNVREPRGQPFPSRLPQGYKEQTKHYDKDKHETNSKKDLQKNGQ